MMASADCKVELEAEKRMKEKSLQKWRPGSGPAENGNLSPHTAAHAIWQLAAQTMVHDPITCGFLASRGLDC